MFVNSWISYCFLFVVNKNKLKSFSTFFPNLINNLLDSTLGLRAKSTAPNPERRIQSAKSRAQKCIFTIALIYNPQSLIQSFEFDHSTDFNDEYGR